jgi:hypothetical protein
MKWIYYIPYLLLFLSSCIEIIDDLTIHNDGSGTLKYNLNLSSSKVKVNSILALDSLDGKKIPSLDEIKSKVQRFVKILDSQNGISNVKVEENYTDYILKFQCDFSSISNLQEGIKIAFSQLIKEKTTPELEYQWLIWDGNKLVRSVPNITEFKIKENDIEQLRKGVYTSITRFDKTIDKCDNPNATISKNRFAVMLKTDIYSLKQNLNILENTVFLSPR